MSAPSTGPAVREIATTLFSSMSVLHDGRGFRPLLFQLARGRPVSPDVFAREAGFPLEALGPMWASLEFDEHGAVIGAGLTLRETPYTFVLGGQRLFTWCALDTLMFPRVLGTEARIASVCPETGAAISLLATPRGVERFDPPELVVSIPLVACCGNVREAFCHESRFFASTDAARVWRQEHAGGWVLSVTEADGVGADLVRLMEHV